MKRLFAFILIIIYAATTAGATLQLHYCMDKLSGWSLSWTESHATECNKCGMEKHLGDDNGCCRDENRVFKIQDDQKASYLSLEILKLPVSTPVSIHTELGSTPATTGDLFPKSNAPPRSCNEDICVRNCIFRI